MAITVSLSTDIGQVRYAIGDDVEGTGVLPNGGNFSDAQINYELGQVGSNIPAAAARLCGNLARRWSGLPQSFSADGLSVNRGDVVKKWQDMQAEFQAQMSGSSFGSVSLDRRDGWTANLETGGSDLLRVDDTTYSE